MTLLPNKVVKSIKDFTPKATTGMYLWFSEGIPKGSAFTVQSDPEDNVVCVKLNGTFTDPNNAHSTLDNPMMWIPTEYFEEEKN